MDKNKERLIFEDRLDYLDAANAYYAARLKDVDMVPLSVMGQLLTVGHMAMRDLEKGVARLGYSFADLQLLGSLGINMGQSVRATDLASTLFVSNAALTKRIARLEKDGLLHRVSSAKDHRAFELHLTDRGQALVDTCIREQAHNAKIVRLLDDLDHSEIELLSDILLRLHKALERDFVSSNR